MSVKKSEKLPVMEHFYTIQGEGVYSGTAAYFVRIGGCDVGCSWCDVKESWDEKKHPFFTVNEISSWLEKDNPNIAVITGGEPLMYDMQELTENIQQKGIRTHIETSGAYELSGTWDWITLSPKKFKFPVDSVIEKANELKIIVFNKSDFDWAEKYAAQVNENCVLLLQPEWGKAAQITPMIIDYVKQNPKWKISLQTHKYLEIP